MTPGAVDVGVDRESAGRPHRARDLVGVGHEGGLHRRGDRRRRFEAQLQLPTARHRVLRLARRRRGKVLVGGRQPRHKTTELEIAEELKDGGAVIGGASRALELERHR